ncbi:MAG: hypothetical protein QNK05_20430 [Myxococcota bacterium]|nr:hypothetical protein [Myxococcota bacterium]
MRRRRAIAATLACCLGVALGCTISQPIPTRRTLVLPAPAPVGHGPGCGVVRLHRIRTESPFERKSVMYRVDGNTYQRDPYTSFFAPPGQVVRQLTGEWLRGARIFDMVLEPGDTRIEDWLLVGTVRRVFVDRVTGVYDEAVLEVEYTLLARQTMRPVFERSYGSVVAASDDVTLDAAWATAMSRVLANLEADLRVLVRGSELCRTTDEEAPQTAAEGGP